MHKEAMDAARRVLADVFGHPAFRTGQEEAVSAVLSGRDAVVVLPTGGGKSLCFQVPALVQRAAGRGRTVVVSPLIALMEDQVRALRERGIPAVALHSGLDAAAKRQARQEAADATLIYVSPERLALVGTRRWLDRLGVALFAIDEAHCITEWGHDFRKDYRRLGELKGLWDVPIVALTATATPRVVDAIETELDMAEPVRVRGALLRPALRYHVEHHRGDKVRVERVAAWLDELGLGRDPAAGRAVVYAGTRKRVVSVARQLRAAGFRVGHYHAGRTDNARATAQERFVEGKAPVLVATTAFGMGIDLPDIRLVAHVSTPPTLESYVQQAGRAGRDGREAHAVLLTAPGDVVTRKRVVKQPTPGEEAGWRAMLDYTRSTRCRQVELAVWFGTTVDPCGICDACVAPQAVGEAVEAVREDQQARRAQRRAKRAEEDAVQLDDDQRDLIVELVRNLRKPVGKRLVALALRGSRSKPVKRAKLEDNPCYGALKQVPERTLIREVEALLAEGRLAPRGKKYPTVWIPEKRVRPARKAGQRKTPTLPPLQRALRNLRRREARRRRWKPYMVFDDATLLAIAAARPTTAAELLAVPGMGPKRVERYGEAILTLVRETGTTS